MRRNSQQKKVQALCANPPRELLLVRAITDIHVRNGYISNGGDFRGAHNWGAVVPYGTVGIIEGSYEGRALISFEQRDGGFVTDVFDGRQYELL